MYTGGGIFGGPGTRHDITITFVTDEVIQENLGVHFLKTALAPYNSLTGGEFVIPQIC